MPSIIRARLLHISCLAAAVGTLFLLLAFDAEAKGYRVRFDNGSQLIFSGDPGQNGKVLFRQGGQEKVLIQGFFQEITQSQEINAKLDNKRRFSPEDLDNVPSDPNGTQGVFLVASYASHTVARIDGKIYVFFSDGTYTPIPFDYRRTYGFSGPYRDEVAFWQSIYITEGDDTYLVIEVRFPNNDRFSMVQGEVFVISEDGSMAGSALIGADKDDADRARPYYELADGILSIKHSARRFDLRRLSEEGRFPVRDARVIFNDKGEPTSPVYYTGRTMPRMEANHALVRSASAPVNASEFDPLRRALAKKSVGSVALLGSAGVGKTELVRSFIAAVKRGDFPEIPRTTHFLQLDAAALGAGSTYVGQFELRVQALLEYCKLFPTVIFADEVHALRGQGTHSKNSNDFFQMVKPALASGQLRIIGTSTDAEFNEAFSGDQALYQRFTKITKNPLDKPATIDALKKFGAFARSPAVLEAIYDISSEYNAIDEQPRKAIRLADEALANLALEGRRGDAITMDDVIRAATTLYEIDPAQFDPELRKKKLLELPAKLDAEIMGHDQAKELIVDFAYQAYMHVHDVTRPRLRILLGGPKGVGKSALAAAYARAMGLPVKKIEMSQYTNPYDTDKFMGEIAAQLRKNAFTVFILDEAEKAHINIQNALLTTFDDGVFTVHEKLNAGSTQNGIHVQVNARNASFFLTTNAGQTAVRTAGTAKMPIGFAAAGSTGEVKVDSTQNESDRQSALAADGLSEFMLDRLQGTAFLSEHTLESFTGVVLKEITNFLKQLAKESGQAAKALTESPEEMAANYAKEFFQPGVSGRRAHEILYRIRSKVARKLLTCEGALSLRGATAKK